MATQDTLSVFDALSSRLPATGYPQLAIRNGHIVLSFNDAADEHTDFVGFLPAHYSGGGLQLLLTWSSTVATSGVVRWNAAFERRPIGDPTHGTFDLDADDFGAATTVDASAPANSGELVQTTLALSSSQIINATPRESFRVRIGRMASDASDTMTGDAQLLLVEVREA